MAAEKYDLEEKFEFTASMQKSLFTLLGVGVVALVIGILLAMFAGGHDDHAAVQTSADQLALLAPDAVQAAQAEGHSHGFSWTTKLWAGMWMNNVFFTGLALIGIFFVAIQYVANAGWSAAIKRVPESFGFFLPVAFGLMLVVFVIGNHDLFHWTHHYLYEKGGPEFDSIIYGKNGFFFIPGAEEVPSIPYFFYLRMIFFFAVWILMFRFIRKQSLAEDLNGGLGYHKKLVKLSATFIIFFAVSSSISAWDWVMSIDTHWFSTMFGWYVFASWFVAGLAAITLVIIFLKELGYLKMVNENHLHDMGKYVFAFSIFWTYIWFSQFLLIYYANIPEESVYFLERLKSDIYSKYIFINLILNFVFPFFVLMTRDSKRKIRILKVVCWVVIIGHWFDFYLMIAPGTMKQNGEFGFINIGLTLIYAAVFIFLMLKNLAKAPLVAKNHPMLQESIHHHV